jgi:type II secretory pathway predicted ATPase ExeA
MFNKFFGFSEKPFEVTPDPKFLYLTRAYQEILSALIYGIRERRGFIAIVGEVGTGKTMMLNALLDRLEHDTKVAFIFNSDLTFRQMLIMALCDLGLATPEENLSKVEAIQRLNDFTIQQLEKGGNVVIIVDEAQSLSHKTMENLRMLSNLETRKHKLVQIILSGQPELDAKLNRPEWRQLVQRISLKRYSTNLGEEDTYGYIQHRIDVAGYIGESLFNERALQRIWEYSEGIPRKINILCDNALLIGYGLEEKRIDEEIVNEAIKDLSWSPFLNHSGGQNSVEADSADFFLEPEEPNVGEAPATSSDEAQKPIAEQITAENLEDQLNTAPEKTTILSDDEASETEFETKSQQFRATIITGILILLFLTMAAWFLIVKSKADVSEISYRQQDMAPIGSSDRQTNFGRQNVDRTNTYRWNLGNSVTYFL